jgi:hypothetical protein
LRNTTYKQKKEVAGVIHVQPQPKNSGSAWLDEGNEPSPLARPFIQQFAFAACLAACGKPITFFLLRAKRWISGAEFRLPN